MKQIKKRKGFTLVELLVVIAILAILATVSVVGYTAFITRAHESNAKTEADQIKQQIVAATLAGEGYLIGSYTPSGSSATSIYVAPVYDSDNKTTTYVLATASKDAQTGYAAWTATALTLTKGGTSAATTGPVRDDIEDLVETSGAIIIKASDNTHIYYKYVEGTTTVYVQISFDANTASEIVSAATAGVNE